MLKFFATNDKKQLDDLYMEIFKEVFPGNVGYVLLFDEKCIGVAKIITTPSISHIEKVGIIPSYRGKGFGDFFTRALMNTLSNVSKTIVINYLSDYFLKFGFVKENDKMSVNSTDIVFPSKCGH